MTEVQKSFLEYLEENYNINEHIDICEEREEFSLEIEMDDASVQMNVVVYCDMGTEVGGEDDEILVTQQNKSLSIDKLEYIFEDGHEMKMTGVFINAVETKLNELIYD